MITEIRNGLNVKRFHTTCRNQEETVGHHSANVCAILLRLLPDSCSGNLLTAALLHDVAEVYTGDVPAPYKWDNPHIKQGLDKGEQDYALKHNLTLPVLTPQERQILKLADMLDLILSSLEDCGRGNQSAWDLVENGAKYIDDMNLPQDLMVKADIMVQEVKSQWRLTISR